MAKTLDVFLQSQQAGQLIQDKDGRLSFTYDPSYLKRKGAVDLSLALPLAEFPYGHGVCHAVFGGMLPDGDVRIRLAKALRVSDKNDISLLAEIGGECAGAVSLWPVDGPGPRAGKGQRKKLSGEALEGIFKQLPTQPLLIGEGVRLSLAGAQNKLALMQEQGQFYLPAENESSTHILKIAADGYEGILENELYCMRLAARVGLPAAGVSVGQAGSVGYICVERFDRERAKDGTVNRVHQEDFCQALGVAPETKYQSEGGPGLAACVELLRKHSARPAADLAALLKLFYFNFLIGNADAHAKNYSILFTEAGPVLAPAYDVLCTAIYKNLGSKMAMKIDSKYDPDMVATRHWEDLAKKCDLKPAFVVEGLRDLAGRIGAEAPALAEALVKDGGPKKVFGEIQAVFQERASKIL